MAIISFKELDDRSGSFDDEFVRDYTRHYLVKSNSVFDQEPEIYAHSLCPVPRKTRPRWDQLAVCVSVEAKLRKRTRYHWDVVAKFSSKQVEQAKQENPLDDPAKITINSELVTQERYTDRNGRPFLNSAGEPIKVKVEIPQNIISVTKNIALYNSWISEINGIINSAPVRIRGKLYPTGTLKVTKVAVGDIEYRNKVAFMVATLEMRENPEGWAMPFLNQGYYELLEHPTQKKNGKPVMVRVRCKDGYYSETGEGCIGQPVSEPVFLDKRGRRPREIFELSPGVFRTRPKLILEPEDIVVLNFDVLRLYDFRRLPLSE